MCLIARQFESLGLPTLVLGSSLDIMEAGQPPRARFINYPLGFESGRFRDKADQLAVVREAVTCFETMASPGIEPAAHEWLDGWAMVKAREKSRLDQRSPRTRRPRYQTEEDRVLAEGTS